MMESLEEFMKRYKDFDAPDSIKRIAWAAGLTPQKIQEDVEEMRKADKLKRQKPRDM